MVPKGFRLMGSNTDKNNEEQGLGKGGGHHQVVRMSCLVANKTIDEFMTYPMSLSLKTSSCVFKGL